MNLFLIFVLAFVEGVTEFLPVSSTGHLILTSAFFGIHEDPFVQQFNIVIQFGAICSVLVLYWRRFLPSNWSFYRKLFIAFLPAALIGLLVKSKIDLILSNVAVVAWSLILGGVVLIWSDVKWKNPAGKTIEQVSNQDAGWIGLLQCFAFIPGVSRSGATILAGLWRGLSRQSAAEFSFFLAVPTLSGAAMIKLVKAWPMMDTSRTYELLLGTVLAFIFALLAIRFFIALVSRFGFKHFGYYRIGLGILVLIFGGSSGGNL